MELSIKPINGWTKARILEVVRARPSKEKAATDGCSVCMYLTPSGNKCAVGLFIPDGHAAQSHTGDAGSLLRRYPTLRQHMPLAVHDLNMFQAAHDSCPVDDVTQALIDWVERNVAEDE